TGRCRVGRRGAGAQSRGGGGAGRLAREPRAHRSAVRRAGGRPPGPGRMSAPDRTWAAPARAPRRRVLIVCYFFPPLAGGGVHRVLGFARHLPPLGWDCTVVCAGPEDYWVRDFDLLAHVPEGTEVLRVAGASALSAWPSLGRRRGRSDGRRTGRTFGWLRRLSDWWLLPDSYVGWARRARG